MKRLVTILILAALALALLAAGAAAGPAQARGAEPAAIAAFSPGAFAEGMAADSHGNLYVSLTTWGPKTNAGEIWRVAPDGAKKPIASMDLTANGMLTGVAIDPCDRVYVAYEDFGDPQEVGSGVYRVACGTLTKAVAFPEGAFPNGIAFHDGRLYVTDSVLGEIWRVRLGAGVATPTTWAESDLLAAGSPEGLGANGLAFFGDALTVSVSDPGRVVRIPVRRDGSPGAVRTICERAELATADGIAYDALGGLWITVNAGTTGAAPSGALYRLSPAGHLTTIADDPGWLDYPTMPVFGTTCRTRSTLFVENGDWDGLAAPDVRVLRIGIPGLPLW
jgi:sugar lactone lactonase YvrE